MRAPSKSHINAPDGQVSHPGWVTEKEFFEALQVANEKLAAERERLAAIAWLENSLDARRADERAGILHAYAATFVREEPIAVHTTEGHWSQ